MNNPDRISKALETLRDPRSTNKIEDGLKFLQEKYGAKPLRTYEEDGVTITVYEARSAL